MPNKKGYYITNRGERVEIKPSSTIELIGKGIVELVIPEGATYVQCWRNPITKLVLPEGIRHIDCSETNLTSLMLPKGIIEVICRGTPLTDLIIPNSVEYLNCSRTKIKKLDLHNDMRYLYCWGLDLTDKLDIPEKVVDMRCDINHVNLADLGKFRFAELNLIVR